MRVMVAPAGFKGTLSGGDAAAAMARGVRGAGAEAIELPVADGGEGTLDALVFGAGGTIMGVIARGPLGIPVRGHLGRLSDGTGVVEMAQASGLTLVPERERDVMRASSQGTGELIKGALARRPPAIVVGLGDSATVDGGMGLGRGLGLRFLDGAGRPLPDGGGALERLACIDTSRIDERLAGVPLIIAADVAVPLRDAARVFAAQKGADAAQVQMLERGLSILAERLEHDLGIKGVADAAGSGAGGGCGAMLLALGAQMRSGADLVLERLDFAKRCEGSHLVLTGEGRLDAQTQSGKAPLAVARVARDAGLPCVAIAGDAEVRDGFDDVRTLTQHFAESADAHARAEEGLEHIARRLTAEWMRK